MEFVSFAVDLKTKTRTARRSAHIYKRMIEEKKVTEDVERDVEVACVE